MTNTLSKQISDTFKRTEFKKPFSLMSLGYKALVNLCDIELFLVVVNQKKEELEEVEVAW